MFMFRYRLEWLIKLFAFKAFKKVLLVFLILAGVVGFTIWATSNTTSSNKVVNTAHTIAHDSLTHSNVNTPSLDVTPQKAKQINEATKQYVIQQQEKERQSQESAAKIFHVQGKPASQQPIKVTQTVGVNPNTQPSTQQSEPTNPMYQAPANQFVRAGGTNGF